MADNVECERSGTVCGSSFNAIERVFINTFSASCVAVEVCDRIANVHAINFGIIVTRAELVDHPQSNVERNAVAKYGDENIIVHCGYLVN